jgi:histidine ammonia-lyase
MAAHGAVRLARMNRNLSAILGVELLAASQGIEFRAPLQTSARLQAVLARVREQVPTLGVDRYMAPDLAVGQGLIAGGAAQAAAGVALEIAG